MYGGRGAHPKTCAMQVGRLRGTWGGLRGGTSPSAGEPEPVSGRKKGAAGRARLLLRRGKRLAPLPHAGKEDGIVAVTHGRLRGRAPQAPAVVLGKDAALTDARDEARMRLVVRLFRLLGDGRHALEHEAGAHTAGLGGGIIGDMLAQV